MPSSNIIAPSPITGTVNQLFMVPNEHSKVSSLSSASSSSSSSSSIVEIAPAITMTHSRTKKLLFFVTFGALLVAAIVTLTVVFSLNKKKSNDNNKDDFCIDDGSGGDFANTDDPMREKELGKLLSLQISFRHGARTPLDYYSYDPNSNLSIWNEIGVGHLTIYGKEFMYRYGQLLRRRYAKFLERIPLRNIDAQTSPVRRVVESEQAVLTAMFPPNGPLQIWSNPASVPLASQWQPIGMSMVEIDRAYVLDDDDANCPRAEQIKAQIDTNSLPAVQALMSENQDFVRRIVEQFGTEYGRDWKMIADLYDPLYCEKVYLTKNFVMPEKLQAISDGSGEDVWESLKVFNTFKFGYPRYLPREYNRLRGGPFVANLLENIQNDLRKSRNSKDDQKDQERFIHLLGSHDTATANALIFLGFFHEQPQFGSGIVVEVREHPQTIQPMVHLYYANVTTVLSVDQPFDCNTKLVDIYSLPLNESSVFSAYCPEISCPLDTFAKVLQPLLPVDIEQECQAIVTK